MLVTLILNSLLASSGFLTLGIFIAWPATALLSIRDSLAHPLNTESQSWIGSTSYVGALIGTVFSILMSRYINARQGLIICGGASLVGCASVLISSLFSLYLIYPGLFLIGCSCGISCPMASVYVSELAGGGNKGIVTSIFNLNLIGGILFANILGVTVEWSYSSLTITIVHAFLFFALFALIPSPYELARAGKSDEVVDVLRKLRNSNEDIIKEEAHKITEAMDDVKVNEKKAVLERMKAMKRAELGKWGVILVVFSMSHLSGTNVFVTFLVDIFSSTGISEYVLVLVTSISEMIFSFLQMMIADRLGRKTFLMLSGLGTSLATAAFAAIFWNFNNQDHKIPIVSSILSSNIFLVSCLVLFFLAVNIGFNPVKYTLLSEMFTPAEQETIAGLCYTWFWLLGFIVVKMFHMMFVKFGLVIICITLSVINMGSVIFTMVFVPETRQISEKSLTKYETDL